MPIRTAAWNNRTVISGDKRSTISKFEGTWSKNRDYAISLIEGGETVLSRALRLLDSHDRATSLEPQCGMAFGEVVTLPRSAMTGGRRELIQRFLLDACEPDTGLIAELGAGTGINLLNLWLWGGPRVPYAALEPTASGRETAEVLAALDPELDLSTFPYDFEHPDYESLPGGHEHALVFSIHSIEQVTNLPREMITGLFGLGRRVTGVHFEPVGWQVLDEPDATAKKFALRQFYNRNLWPLLSELAAAGELVIDTVKPDLFGDKYKNPGTLIVWHRKA